MSQQLKEQYPEEYAAFVKELERKHGPLGPGTEIVRFVSGEWDAWVMPDLPNC